MNGAGIFNFAIKRVPAVIDETLQVSGTDREAIDYFVLHQSNLFIMRHLAKKMKIPEAKIPFSIQQFGSAGGPSVPLTMTQGNIVRPADRALRLLLVGYGVGLSWGTALLSLPPDSVLDHVQVSEPFA
jgi:3-oxoacyl-[acyl-carrier-protein] synthase-3